MASGLNGMFLSHELGGGHDDPRFPSFFEVFMQDRIDQSLKPAARHVAMVLAERFPRLLFLLERFDEAFALLSLLLERHYLNKNDALLAESLYGFRRARYPAAEAMAGVDHNGGSGSGNSNGTGMGALTPADRRRALALTVLAPYAKAKLDALYNKWSAALPPAPSSSSSGSSRARRAARQQMGRRLGGGDGDEDEGQEQEEEQEQEELGVRLRRAFVAMYPLLHASYEGSYFVYQWAYLLGRTKYYSPLLHLAGQALRRVTREDLEPSAASASASALAPAGATPASSLGARVARSLKVALVLAVVAFKVTEWWMATPEMVGALGGGPGRRIVPPVPDPPSPAPNGLPLPKDPSLCPLCKQPRANPAISPAGIAYCYRCLLAHVREAGAFCPVTLQACTEEQVRRVYLS